MKKTFLPLLLGALMASCANNEPNMNDQNGNLSPLEVQGYLSFNIVAPGGLNTRAEDDIQGDYEYGQSNENYIGSVRLYFFDDEGNGVAVRKNPIYDADPGNQPEFFSYYDWSPTPGENQLPEGYEAGDTFQDPNNSGDLENETVEKVVSVIVALTAKPKVFPTQVAAIVNPTDDVKTVTLNNPMCDLDDLQGAVFDNLTDLTDNNFLMSSSVYINGDGDLTITQPVDEEVNLATSQTEAQNHPINVYVERVVARLDMNLGLTAADNGYYATQTQVTTQDRVYDGEEAPEGQLDEEDIYVKFLGWAVTSTPTTSRVIKSINPEWGADDALFGVVNQPWYIPGYHRSFWATNPDLPEAGAEKPSYVWYTFNELSGEDAQNPNPQTPIKKLGFDMPEGDDDTMITYMQENANPFDGSEAADPKQPTKVIYAAQLVNSEGEAITVASWNDLYFTLQGLQNLAAKMLDMYYIDSETGKYTHITGDQITFITASQFFGTNPIFSDTPNYTVYATLTSATGDDANDPIKNAKGLTWYHLNDNLNPDNAEAKDYTQISAGSINKYMQTVFGNAQIWNNGYTYYYYTIRHLGAVEKPGFYGVVRNHIYSGTVNGLKGLGTPVWDPNEPIYPEKPEKDGNNLSVQIKVLAWRLVTDSYEFEW